MECWFDFGSNYSYLSIMRIETLAREAGVAVRWRPFLLGPIFRELGWETSPFVLQKEKGAYVWQDMIRQCRKYALPWRQPSVFPRGAVLATRVALRGADAPWIGAYCRAIMLRNFADDADIGDPAVVQAVLDALGLPAAMLIADAQTEAARAALRAQTVEARARGIFGAPSFFVGDALYWGNDRLDDALAAAASMPSQQARPADPDR